MKMTFLHRKDPSFLLDSLFCDEPHYEEEEEEEEIEPSDFITNTHDASSSSSSLFPLLLLEQDLLWEDEELNSLFSKEKDEAIIFNHHHHHHLGFFQDPPCLSMTRREAVEWILKVNTHYGFSALTSTLAINYFDRFLLSFKFQAEKPWMIQLVAVTCLSLAAKVEETQVPLLLDLQVEDTKYVFEAKTIMRMEVLVLSTLKWKMHPVTPLSFLDHIIRRLGFKSHLHWEFLKRCEHLLLSALSDSRFVGCLPSVLATATMLHVIDQIHHQHHKDGEQYKKQLLGVLKTNKEKVEECYKAIEKIWNNSNRNNDNNNNNGVFGDQDHHHIIKCCCKKRKYEEINRSPSGIMMDSVLGSSSSSLSSSLLCTSPYPLLKKTTLQQQQRMKLSPLSRVVIAVVAPSP